MHLFDSRPRDSKRRTADEASSFVELPVSDEARRDDEHVNCEPCIVGKSLGRRECPGLKARRLVVGVFARIAGLFKRRQPSVTPGAHEKETDMPLTANDVMQKREILTVHTDTTVGELEHLLVDRDVSGTPVLNSEDELVGLVSQRDVLRLFNRAREAARSMEEVLATPVRQIMETRLRTVEPSTELAAIAKLMRTHHIHRVPVVEEGRIVGLISTLDLVHPLEDSELVRMIWGHPRRSYWTPFKPARSERDTAKAGR